MKKKNEIISRLIIPGAEHWECWSIAEGSEQWEREDGWEEGFSSSASSREHTVLGMPVLQASTSVFRVPESEAGVLSDLAALHLEGMGVYQPDAHGAILHGTLVLGENVHDGMVRVLAFCQDAPKDDDSPANWDVARAVPAAFCWNWPGDGMVLWRELGRWQVAVVEEGRPIHFQTLTALPGEPQWVTELTCIGQALSLRESASRSISAVWVAADEEWREAIEQWVESTGIDFCFSPSLTPKLPEAGVSLITPQMALGVARRRARRRQRQVLMAAAAVVLLLAAWGVVQMLLLENKLEDVKARVAESQPEYERLRQVQNEWRTLERWMGNDGFPLEVMLQLHRAKASRDIRFTEFTMSADGDIYLRGTVPSRDQALNYGEDLRRSRALTSFQWETPYPRQRDNNTFEFGFNGMYRFKPVQGP